MTAEVAELPGVSDQRAPIIVYADSHTSREALLAYKELRSWGYAGTTVLRDGFGGWQSAGLPTATIPPIEELTFARLDSALDRLGRMVRPDRQAFVAGATAAVLHDGRTTVEEAELIRVVADAVRQPVPPLIPA